MTLQTKILQSIFPDLPRNAKLVDEQGNITSDWSLFFSQLSQALQINFKNEGIVVPPLSAANIALLIGLTSNNNIIYDSTNSQFKGNINGTWKTFTLV
jgi:hypothetical protein